MDDLTGPPPAWPDLPSIRSTMTRAQRAQELLRLVEMYGWTLDFITGRDRPGRVVPGRRVHVVGPDEDQPRYANVVEALVAKRIRTVCGLVLYLTPMDGCLGSPFPDELLCQSCHAAFGDRSHVIFGHNTEDRIGHSNQGVRLLVEMETDPAWRRLMDTAVRFWVCPVEEHRRRVDDRGGPAVTVEWRGDVACCSAPGCGRSSTDGRGGDDGDAAQERPTPGG